MVSGSDPVAAQSPPREDEEVEEASHIPSERRSASVLALYQEPIIQVLVQEEDGFDLLGDVFSMKKPRDVIAGTASGIKNVAKGFGLGLGALASLPYLGAKDGGIRGAIKGVAVGLVSAVGTSTAGTVIGCMQFARGALNTPKAISQKSKGKKWNRQTRDWEVDYYNLQQEAEAVLGENQSDDGAGDNGATSRRPSRRVADTTFYDTLEISASATPAEIKKAFYKASLKYHPDKNVDDPSAHEKFQSVSEAYQTLSDVQKRAAYDKHGLAAVNETPKIDAGIFFAILFGSSKFESYIGKLQLASGVDDEVCTEFLSEEGSGFSGGMIKDIEGKMKKRQKRREVQLAVDLADKLDAAMESDDWEAKCQAEAERLADIENGVEMLHIIGWVYENKAQQYVHARLGSIWKAREQVHDLKAKASVVASVGKTYLAVRKAMKTQDALEAAERAKEEAAKSQNADSALGGASNGTDPIPEPSQAPTVEAPRSSRSRFRNAFIPTSAANDSGPTAAPPSAAAAASGPTAAPPSAAAAAATPGVFATGVRSPAYDILFARHNDQNDPFFDDRFDLPETDSAPLFEGSAPSAPPEGAKAEDNRPRWFGGRKAPKVPGMNWFRRKNRDRSDAGAEATAAQVPPATAEETRPPLKVGTAVVFVGLSAEEMNGMNAVILEFDATRDRYICQPEEGEKNLALKRDNLYVPPSEDEVPPVPEEFRHMHESMPTFVDTLWNITVIDVEFTLRAVCTKVLRDMSVSAEQRKRRAELLYVLGTAFKAAKKPPSTDAAANEASRPDSRGSERRSWFSRRNPEARKAENEKKAAKMEQALFRMAAGDAPDDDEL